MLMQLLQPAGVVDIRLAARDIFHMPRIDQEHFEATRLQNLEGGNPVNPRRFHRHRRDAEVDEPIGHLMQIVRKTLIGADRLGREVRRHGHDMKTRANVNPRGIGVNREHFQGREPHPSRPVRPGMGASGDEIAVGVLRQTLQRHGPARSIPHQALQLLPPMGGDLRSGVQGKALDAGTAGTGERGQSPRRGAGLSGQPARQRRGAAARRPPACGRAPDAVAQPGGNATASGHTRNQEVVTYKNLLQNMPPWQPVCARPYTVRSPRGPECRPLRNFLQHCFAAFLWCRRCTRRSRAWSSCSPARPRACRWPGSVKHTASLCHLSPGWPRRRRRRLAEACPHFRPHCRRASTVITEVRMSWVGK